MYIEDRVHDLAAEWRVSAAQAAFSIASARVRGEDSNAPMLVHAASTPDARPQASVAAVDARTASLLDSHYALPGC
jgi:hypothetical protein